MNIIERMRYRQQSEHPISYAEDAGDAADTLEVLLAALKSARHQLEVCTEAETGESYNDTKINAAIAKAEAATGRTK